MSCLHFVQDSILNPSLPVILKVPPLLSCTVAARCESKKWGEVKNLFFVVRDPSLCSG